MIKLIFAFCIACIIRTFETIYLRFLYHVIHFVIPVVVTHFVGHSRHGGVPACLKEEVEWTSNELRNSLRSVDWDIEDLEETENSLEKNPRRFKLSREEVLARREFIDRVKNEVYQMKESVLGGDHQAQKKSAKKKPPGMDLFGRSGPGGYTSLRNEEASPEHRIVIQGRAAQLQRDLIGQQEQELDQIHTTVGTLKVMSKQINNELEEQSVMLDDLGNEMDSAENRVDIALKKMAKVLNMSNDRRQWLAIIVLSCILLFVISLFFIL
ncbi:syntaxin-6-like isoform X1 [Varroa destructor]|uniref:t-SNARE coiled-coil homology domain-containing protein n=1 Tax=Varroa destructor TaxID=109461 RepID=A0A7M7JGV1_VARDE|nr:syntaxin-6-like isoform X1 [Varroa destructor]